MITKEIEIDDLIRDVPESVKYLQNNGIKCVICGEPVWGTLEQVCKQKGFTDQQINVFVTEIAHLQMQSDDE